ncbi:DUF4365 domain-containing protein [Vibrio sp. Vb2704]|uniref:DUF4365 domain-containing protein n=1 Tax=Vibrio TaxID=662 RepID=UPI001DC7E0D3|nr:MULTISPECIES: DUF4365 domain-containing protein [Vibrio]EJG0483335.1 DUF4365 domain-containing protein [Vibrio alginolyticus]EKL9830044.1 DUF4365 domain-containing protein [Vibrio alginolyticus]MCR9489044.1 DUF4365 domain-containing protein [Vibrio alginolyticus]MDW1626292.1 DUF4365 domain-containing protein [Vibrio sp. Vb2704]
MKFESKASHGKAGEFYLAYWVCHVFGWPCRLLDIDVGIDAQIEIFDDINHSTGEFIGAQVKTTQDNNPNVQVHLKNLEYWESIDDPIILVSITLEDGPKIYWKLINGADISDLIIRAKNNESEKVTVNFTESNTLSESDKEQFKELTYIKKATQLDKKCCEFDDEIVAINELFILEGEVETDPVALGLDLISAEDYLVKLNKFYSNFDPIKSIVTNTPLLSRLSTQYIHTKNNVDLISRNASEFVSYIKEIDIDYGYEIRDRWMISSTNKTLRQIFEDKYS